MSVQPVLHNLNVTSIYFFFFLVVTLIVYYRLNRRAQNIWLLLVSYLFLISWAWEFALIS